LSDGHFDGARECAAIISSTTPFRHIDAAADLTVQEIPDKKIANKLSRHSKPPFAS
jgi:hypothetical protein